MNTRLISLGLGLCLALVCASCIVAIGSGCGYLHRIEGSGVEREEVRAVGAFKRIDVRNSADVEVTIGEPASCSIRGDDNLLGAVTTDVEGGTLTIGMQSGSYSFRKGLKVKLVTPALERVAISGSSDTHVQGLSGGRFEAHISGSGDIRAQGSVDRLDATISGSGNLDLFELRAKEASVEISGSGNIKVCALDTLDAHVAGSGDIRYRGDPKLSKHVSGSGSISRE